MPAGYKEFGRVTTSVQDILSRLRKVRRTSRGWTACCPAHNDRRPSLGIWIAKEDGGIILKCFSGCPTKSVWAALGIDGRSIPRAPSLISEEKKSHVDFEAILQRCRLDTLAPLLERLSLLLGVSVESLRRLGAVWHKEHSAWAFPMRTWTGHVVGIRMRNEAGRKWAIADSQGGMFIPANQSPIGPLLVCEGPTDTAAVLDLGYAVIGRQSCSAGIEDTLAYIRSIRGRDIVIFANRDSAKQRKDGSIFYPGQDGAIALARAIGRPVKIILPPRSKDAREWIRSGATRADVDFLIENTNWTISRKNSAAAELSQAVCAYG